MDYMQFVNEMETKVQEYAGQRTKVCVHMTVKNNGRERTGLMLVQEGINISPTIYLEEYYEQFQHGNSPEQIAGKILALYKEVRFQDSWEGRFVQSYQNVRDTVVCRLINREKNRKLLEDTPYLSFLDLAIVCYVLIDLNPQGTAVMLVKEEHLKLWNVTAEQLFESAQANSERLFPAEFAGMKDVIADMIQLDISELEKEDGMYVLSNRQRSYGAVCMTYDGVMERIATELRENFFVIPSSVHEVIVIPESMAPEKFEIEEIVAEINETQVEEEEVLSDRVYYYSIKEKRLL